jgi:hypothetical protein
MRRVFLLCFRVGGAFTGALDSVLSVSCFIGYLLCIHAQVLHRERLSGDEKLMDDLVMLGLEPAAFGHAEPLVREREIGDGLQCRLHQAELFLETGAERRERRCRAI